MPESPVLVSIHVGAPRLINDGHGPAWSSAIFKPPVHGPVWLSRLNLVGDAQADLSVHGGPDKAVLAYSADHYPSWRNELNIPHLDSGGFGENFTILGQTERGLPWRYLPGGRGACGSLAAQVALLEAGAQMEPARPACPCSEDRQVWLIPARADRRQGHSGDCARALQAALSPVEHSRDC